MRTRSPIATLALGALAASVLIAPDTVLSAAPAAAATAVAVPATSLQINEVVSNGGDPDDWIEFVNTGTEPFDLSGFRVQDDSDKNPFTFADGTIVAPGEYLVIDTVKKGSGDFDFGLGGNDMVRLFDTEGALVDQVAWSEHGLPSMGRDADGVFRLTAAATKGAANEFSTAGGGEGGSGGGSSGGGSDPVETEIPGSVVLNEVDSQPADWVELYNPGTTSFDLTGFELRDNADDHRWRFPAGAAIGGGEFLVVDENSAGLVYDDKTETWSDGLFREPIGIGGADEIRLFNPAGELIDRTGVWTAHAAIDGDMAAATLARCIDGEGSFELAYATPGASNNCVLPAVVINEVESNGDATDWVEIKNVGATTVDISGWTLMDNDPIGHAADVTPVAAGTTLAAGDYFVFDQNRHFGFGLGGADQATVRNAHGQTVAEYAWTTHASGVYARCADGVGEFRDLEVSTKGLANACGNPVRINEVVTNPVDWIELANPTDSPLDVSGIVVKDDDDSHAYEIPAGTTIAAGGYHVIEADQLGFGLGKADSVRLFEGEDLINETTWGPDHPLPSWGRCPDMSGSFAVTAEATKGAPNFCEGEFIAEAWPGAAETQVLDPGPMFLSDSSGLDSQLTDDGTFLWAVDNGTGTFWKLAVAADGTVTFVDGWADGKRARFQKDADSPSAAGPDAEGITIDGDGFVYLAVERDNSAKGVNFNAVLKLDPNAAGPDVVASQEWDLTSLLPAVGANLGLEAIEWVADADLLGKLWDDNTGAPYNPADYPGHGSGLFFVGVEDQGQLFAVALLPGGEAEIVAELTAGLGGIMALDYDTVLDVLWAVCDDGCSGTAAQLTLNGTDTPDVQHVLRPGGLPNINNEGFATAPTGQAADGKRAAWWFADGYASESLRLGWLTFESEHGGGDTGGGDSGSAPSADELTDDTRGGITAPGTIAAGSEITITVGTEHNGKKVTAWLFSTPTNLGTVTVLNGEARVSVPATVAAGDHRLAVYAADGTLIGWTNLTVVVASGGSVTDAGTGGAASGSSGAGLANTGSTDATVPLVAGGGLLLLLSGIAFIAARRAQLREESVDEAP